MIISPDKNDFSTILNILGRLMIGLSAFMCIPLAVALITHEYNPLYDFAISLFLTASCGLLLMILFPFKKEISWIHTFFVVSFGWMASSVLGAVPLYFSGHYLSFVDAWFEAMSGFATTGLTLVKDLDHLSFAHNMWRHLIMFIGGQGIILASISLITQVKGAVLGLYMSEARTEKILPNIVATARFIWKVSMIYLVVGVVSLAWIIMRQGVVFERAFLHGLWLFFAAFDTGGFAPQAQNIAYYHNWQLEIATVILMMLGAINFNLHFWIWFKGKKEVFKNFETRTFLFTFSSLLLLVFFALKHLNPFVIFHDGFYQLISAHTGCGFSNLAAGGLSGMSSLALIAIIFAMMIGGGVCSTTGAIKLMRVGIIFKSFLMEIKRWMMPLKSVHKDSYHHLGDVILDNRKIREAFVFCGLFLFTYVMGALIGMMHGYPALFALFESVSATANVGLSVGITSPAMPLALKLTYIFQMWLGRLEFLSIFVSIGFIGSLFRK